MTALSEEARGYEPKTSQARLHLTAVMWCSEPLANAIEDARRAKDGLISGGERLGPALRAVSRRSPIPVRRELHTLERLNEQAVGKLLGAVPANGC